MLTNRLFERIDARIDAEKEEGDASYFAALMGKLEYVLKVEVAALSACIDDDSDRHRYSLEHHLIRADSLGVWNACLQECLKGPTTQVMFAAARPLRTELTQRIGSGDWRYSVVSMISVAASELGLDISIPGRVSLLDFFDTAVRLRNRRSHGVPGAAQCARACPQLHMALDRVIQEHSLFKAHDWAILRRNASTRYSIVPIIGNKASFDFVNDRDQQETNPRPDGTYLLLEPGRIVRLPLLFGTSNLEDVFLPNGNYKGKRFESLSYITNTARLQDATPWLEAPRQRPTSETRGRSSLEILNSVASNVPERPGSRYVRRRHLEYEIVTELANPELHRIVALTGSGGTGKTTLALFSIYEIDDMAACPYEHILWISARDIDLLDDGPRPVTPEVTTIDDIASSAMGMMKDSLLQPPDDGSDLDNFERWLCRQGWADGAAPTLFVFDNFETMQRPIDTFNWIDTHIRSPNKALITTRMSKDFRGAFAIDVPGMSDDEAHELIDRHAKFLGIDRQLSKQDRAKIVRDANGHPYVIKILLGEAKRRQRSRVGAKVMMGESEDLLAALFDRTYNELSGLSQKMFLLLCSWRVDVPEVAVQTVVWHDTERRYTDIKNALDDLVYYSLVDRTDTDDGSFLSTPLAATVFGRHKLQISPFKVAIDKDKSVLMRFGHGSAREGVLGRIETFMRSVDDEIQNVDAASKERRIVERLAFLESLANGVPRAFMLLAELVRTKVWAEILRDYATLSARYVKKFIQQTEHAHDKVDAWTRLADFHEEDERLLEEVHAICEALLLTTSKHESWGDLVDRINYRLRQYKDDGRYVPKDEIQEMLRRVTTESGKRALEMTAQDCSRLAWLSFHTGDLQEARRVAKMGLRKDAANKHCVGILSRL